MIPSSVRSMGHGCDSILDACTQTEDNQWVRIHQGQSIGHSLNEEVHGDLTNKNFVLTSESVVQEEINYGLLNITYIVLYYLALPVFLSPSSSLTLCFTHSKCTTPWPLNWSFRSLTAFLEIGVYLQRASCPPQPQPYTPVKAREHVTVIHWIPHAWPRA